MANSGGGKDEGYAKLKKKVFKTMLECMFGNNALPSSYINLATYRASQPLIFTDADGKFKEQSWQYSLGTTCAMIKSIFKEVPMELETTRKDRDYLFGRLLAVANEIERRAMYEADKQNERPTNAIKLMNSFSIRPFTTYGTIWTQLLPYIQQIEKFDYYQYVINEIMGLFQEGDFEDNKPLSPLYLLGYSAQDSAFKTKNKTKNKNNEESQGE